MSLQEVYLYLFFDSFVASLAFMTNTVTAYHIILGFNVLSKAQAIPLALLGNFCGSMLSFFFGFILRSIKKSQDSTKLKVFEATVQTKLLPLALLSSVTIVGPIVVVLAGFFKANPKTFAVLSTASWFLYYVFYSS